MADLDATATILFGLAACLCVLGLSGLCVAVVLLIGWSDAPRRR